MSVLGGVALFLAGAAVGSGAVAYNKRCVSGVEKRARRECETLRNEVYNVKLEAECDRAYREGYAEGRKNPLTDVERLAQTFEKRRVSVRTQKGA